MSYNSDLQSNNTELQDILRSINELPEADSGVVAEPLVGTTDDITPRQVYEAIVAGQSIMISHSTDQFGTLVFTSFAIAGDGSIVGSSCTVDVIGELINASLTGYVPNDLWQCSTPTLITEEGLSEAVNTALAQAKESGEFDGDDGITPHIGANGNWFIGNTDTGKPSQGSTGATGPQGPAYTLTDTDKTSIAEAVLAALPTWEGGSY